MPTYQYQAKTLDGQKQKGRLEAADEIQLAVKLHEDGLFLTKWKRLNDQEQKASYHFNAHELSEFSREIGTMLDSGVSLIRAMAILLKRDVKPRIKTVYEGIYRGLQQGATLSEAMEQQKDAFPRLMINMMKTGEASGSLENTAMKMAGHYEKEHRLNNKIKSASTYPIILVVLTVVIVLFIFMVILPQFFSVFESFNLQLPGITRFVLAVSDVLTKYWLFLLVGVLCLWLALSLIARIPRVRRMLDRQKLKLPVFGKLLRTIYTARFARTLSSLYSSGLSMINALRICGGIVGNAYIEEQFEEVVKDVRNGELLSYAIEKVDGFDIKLSSTIYVGEEAGRLDDMLDSVASSFDYEAEIAMQRMVTLLEPILIVTMAVIIGTVMLSVMLPIYQLYQNIS